MKKDYKEELYKFVNFIKDGKNFAFVRLSEHERYILDGTYPEWQYKEWSWKPDKKHFDARNLMLNATLCDQDNFYIGLPTHGGKSFFDEMKGYTKQKEEYLTYTCLFMDSNYKYFISDMYPELKKHDIIGVFSEKSNVKNSGLNINKIFYITNSAYVNSLHVIDEIKKYVVDNKIKNKIFLITGGCFANISIYELFKLEKENTYIDVGSALDIYLGLGQTRAYNTYNNSNPILV